MNPILSSILLSVQPLVANDNLFRMFRTIRRAALSGASAVPSLVMGVACLIIVFKLIKLTYDMESDEQQAGFGGVTLWQIVRPVVILFALNIYPVLIGAIDGVANSVSISIVNAADKQDSKTLIAQRIAVLDAASNEDMSKEQTQAVMDKYTDKVSSVKAAGSSVGQAVSAGSGPIAGKIAEWTYNLVSGRKAQNEAIDEELEIVAENTEVELDAKERRERKKALRRWFSSYYKCDETLNADGFELKNPGTWIPGLCDMLYDFAFVIIECGAEIILCILCFAGPVVLTVSLLDSYKHVFGEFVMRYFQFSFWKVVAAIINWAVQCARIGACSAGKNFAVEQVQAVASGQTAAAGSAAGALWITALISLAGIFCFSKIGELAGYFIPVNGGGMASGSGTAGAAAAGAAGGAMGAASTLAGGVKGIRASAASKEQAESMRNIAGGVSSISQSMEGSKVSKDN